MTQQNDTPEPNIEGGDNNDYAFNSGITVIADGQELNVRLHKKRKMSAERVDELKSEIRDLKRVNKELVLIAAAAAGKDIKTTNSAKLVSIPPRQLIEALDLGLSKLSIDNTFLKQLTQNYVNVILAGDTNAIGGYDRMFVNKLVADTVNITDDMNTIEADMVVKKTKLHSLVKALVSQKDTITEMKVKTKKEAGLPTKPTVTPPMKIIEVGKSDDLNGIDLDNLDL